MSPPRKAKGPAPSGPDATTITDAKDTAADKKHATSRWAKVPGWILDIPLTRQELRCYVALSMDANAHRLSWTAQRTIAERLGCARRSVQVRLLPRLEAVGVILKVGTMGRSDVYLVPEEPLEMDASGRVHSRVEMAAFSSMNGRILKTEWTHGHTGKRALTEVAEEAEASTAPEGTAPTPEVTAWIDSHVARPKAANDA